MRSLNAYNLRKIVLSWESQPNWKLFVYRIKWLNRCSLFSSKASREESVTSMEHPMQQGKMPESINATAPFASLRMMLLLHLACGLGLALAFWVAVNFFSVTLIHNPAETLFIVWAVDALVVIFVFSQFRLNPYKCSYVKAIVRGLMGLPAGALVNALGAIVLGAPVGTQHFKRTVNWSLLMSVFTFVPAASVFGSSWTDWHRIFAHSKPMRPVDFIICLPAHGAIIGAWFGAWPMPLDWERPWQVVARDTLTVLLEEQEWPICVTYGAIILGYLIGVIASFGFVVYNNRQNHLKRG